MGHNMAFYSPLIPDAPCEPPRVVERPNHLASQSVRYFSVLHCMAPHVGKMLVTGQIFHNNIWQDWHFA